MKSTTITSMLMFVVALAILATILSAVFGKLIIYNIMAYMGASDPEFVSEDVATILMVSAYAPGDVIAGIKSNFQREFIIENRRGLASEYQITVKGSFMILENRPGQSSNPFLYNNKNVEKKSVLVPINGILYIRKISNNLTIDSGGKVK